MSKFMQQPHTEVKILSLYLSSKHHTALIYSVYKRAKITTYSSFKKPTNAHTKIKRLILYRFLFTT